MKLGIVENKSSSSVTKLLEVLGQHEKLLEIICPHCLKVFKSIREIEAVSPTGPQPEPESAMRRQEHYYGKDTEF